MRRADVLLVAAATVVLLCFVCLVTGIIYSHVFRLAKGHRASEIVAESGPARLSERIAVVNSPIGPNSVCGVWNSQPKKLSQFQDDISAARGGWCIWSEYSGAGCCYSLWCRNGRMPGERSDKGLTRDAETVSGRPTSIFDRNLHFDHNMIVIPGDFGYRGIHADIGSQLPFRNIGGEINASRSLSRGGFICRSNAHGLLNLISDRFALIANRLPLAISEESISGGDANENPLRHLAGVPVVWFGFRLIDVGDRYSRRRRRNDANLWFGASLLVLCCGFSLLFYGRLLSL